MAQMRILITDGGTHPPEKWAEVIADDLVEIAPTASAEKVQAGQQLRYALIAELIPAIADAQNAEKEGRHGKSCHCGPHVDAMSKAINKVANASLFKDHFKRDTVQDRIRLVCGIHSATMMQEEAEHKQAKKKERGQAGNGPDTEESKGE